MNKKAISTMLICCTSGFFAFGSASPSTGATAASAPDFTEPVTATNFQASVERLHHDLLLSDCHSTNPEIRKDVELLADRQASVSERCEAASRLGSLKYMAQSALVSLVRIYSSESDYSVKSAVALALLKISPAVAVLQILPGIESKDEDYKQMCVSVLASGGKDVVPPLVKALKCPDPNICRQSAKALSELGATAISAVNVLREISSNIDEGSLYTKQAAQSALAIKRDYDEKHGADVAFNATNWKDESGRHYRFRMVNDLIASRTLIGLHTAQLHDMLGRGVSFFKGTQWRYALGSRGHETALHQRNHSRKENFASSSEVATKIDSSNNATHNNGTHLSARVSFEEEREQFLIVHVADDVVTNCQVVGYDPELWNVNNLDRPAAKIKASLNGAGSTTNIQNIQSLPILAAACERLGR